VLGDSEEFRKLPPKKGKSEDEVRVFCSTSIGTLIALCDQLLCHSPSSSSAITTCLINTYQLPQVLKYCQLQATQLQISSMSSRCAARRVSCTALTTQL
jgi:hypothetical protein